MGKRGFSSSHGPTDIVKIMLLSMELYQLTVIKIRDPTEHSVMETQKGWRKLFPLTKIQIPSILGNYILFSNTVTLLSPVSLYFSPCLEIL